MLNSENFNSKLQLLFDFYGLTAGTFADKIGVQRSSLSHLLSGRNKPSLEFVLRITDHFKEVDLYWLLNDIGTFPKVDNIPLNLTVTKTDAILFEEDKVIIQPTQINLDFETKQIHSEPQTGVIPDNITETINKNIAKKIEKIVFFYADGTFYSYNPQ